MSLNSRLWVNTRLPFDISSLTPGNKEPPQEVILLLHGFAESGARILKKLAPALPERLLQKALVIAPNAPFLMPHRTEHGYSATYSWYFYDPTTDEYAIDMSPAVEFLKNGLMQLGIDELPKRIIGFSQGGFLAPIAATSMRHVQHFIGIGCETLVDEIPGAILQAVPYRVDGVHGTLDESVNLERARASHQRLIQHGVKGAFHAIDGSGHRIDDAIREAVKRLLS